MSRLTKKGTRMVNDFREADWYNKLANLEDLEDELGCSILDVFKALKEGIKIDFGEQLIPPKLYYDDVYNKWKFKIIYYSTAVGLYDVKDVINGINVESDTNE